MSLLGGLESVGLAEMNERAGLMTRFDTKHVLGHQEMSDLVARLGDRMRVLRDGDREQFAYVTVYFDDEHLRSYRDHAMGRIRRFKTRLRHYADTGDVFVEAKMRLPAGQTVKVRRKIHGFDATPIAGPPSDEMAEFLSATVAETLGMSLPGKLMPTLVVRFDRATIVTDAGERSTVDSHLSFAAPDGRPLASVTEGVHVVEVKSPTQRSEIGTVLLRSGCKPVAVSKYCMGIGLSRPDARANAWRPAMRRLGLIDSRLVA